MQLHHDPADPKVDLLILLWPAGQELTAASPLTAWDRALGGALIPELEGQGFTGRAKQRAELPTLGRLPFERLIVLGIELEPGPSAAEQFELGEALGAAAQQTRAKDLAIQLPSGALPPHRDALLRGLQLGGYKFSRYRSPSPEEDERPDSQLESVTFVVDDPKDASPGPVDSTVRAVCLARDLVNEPAAVMTPVALAAEAEKQADLAKLECQVHHEQELAELGLELLGAVGRGSVNPPCLAHLVYRPQKPRVGPIIGLVGKGVTFDSGGLSLKPSASMLDMKSDMAGAATVLAAMTQLAHRQVPHEVHGFLPLAENMPSDRAYRLGDVLRGLDGPTVEVTNTDAEGRLILADALSYARSQGCELLVDLATLTGACVVALGPDIAGVMSNDEAICEAWLSAAEAAGEPMWRLPLPKALNEQLKSSIADCKNSGGRWGGALTAGLFLQKFVGKTPWIHVDLAGPAWAEKGRPGRPAGGTGFGVASLLAFLSAGSLPAP